MEKLQNSRKSKKRQQFSPYACRQQSKYAQVGRRKNTFRGSQPNHRRPKIGICRGNPRQSGPSIWAEPSRGPVFWTFFINGKIAKLAQIKEASTIFTLLRPGYRRDNATRIPQKLFREMILTRPERRDFMKQSVTDNAEMNRTVLV